MAGIPGLTSTRSLSRNGFSQVTVIFTDQTDIYFARQQVAERLAQARETMPEGVEPALAPITTGLGEVLMWTVDYKPFNSANLAKPGQTGWQAGGAYLTPEGDLLTTPQQRATYLRTVQDWIIAPQMRTAPGLAGVDTVGGYVKEYAVRPDTARLSAYGLGMGDLIQALDRANTQAGAGYVQRAGEALTVRTDALASTVEDLAQAPVVNRSGLVVRVADVATVEIGQDTIIYPNTYLQGVTAIGHRCRWGPNTIVRDSTVGDGCTIEASVIEGAVLEEGVDVYKWLRAE